LLKFDESFRYAIHRLLKGEKLNEIRQVASEYIDSLLLQKKNKEVWEYVEKAEKLHLISSSIDPVIEALAEKMGASWQSTILETKNGLLTGRINKDLKGDKWANLDPSFKKGSFSVFTDNLDDLELLKHADERYVIINSERHRSYWEKNLDNFTFIKPQAR
jgi:phosphoserine phosphatase